MKALTKEMLAEIVAAYGTVAGLAKRAGFEMLLIHGGHGWLLNQFLSPWFNKRADEYGGSLENRCRLAVEVLQAVRAAVGPGFPLEFRLSGSELFEGGYDLDEGIRIAQVLEPYIDMIHVSAGTYQRGFGDTHPSMFKPHGCNVYLAAAIKKHVSIPVATLGGLNDPAQMEGIIASGQADVVYMARALLADPFLPRKVMENRAGEITRCLRCFTCMAERAATSTRRCTVNPLIPPIEGLRGDNVVVVNDYYLEKDKVTDEVVVLGGGLAGCEAAIHLAQEGKKVALVEMRDVLAPDANVRHRPLLLKEMEGLIDIHTGLKGLKVTPEGVVCADKDNREVLIKGRTVICALGQKPRKDVVEELRDCAPWVTAIGDCNKVATITNAVYQGYRAALDI